MTAYLTSVIGPSETASDQIATSTVSVGAGPELDTFFSGFSLAAGTYYLVLANGDNVNDYYWLSPNGAGGTTITTDSGVTFEGDYFAASVGSVNGANPPASVFGASFGDNGLNFQVTGDSGSVVPEPSSISLLLIGMAGGMCLLGRKLTA
jgi:hypothetical protein